MHGRMPVSDPLLMAIVWGLAGSKGMDSPILCMPLTSLDLAGRVWREENVMRHSFHVRRTCPGNGSPKGCRLDCGCQP